MGDPIPDLAELAKRRAAALVIVTCDIPAGGGRTGDVFDVRVSVMHTATDIAGGTLLVAPLRGPLPGQGVYAFARGEVTVENRAMPTIGIVRQGAQLVRDLAVTIDGSSFNLVLQPAYAGTPRRRRSPAGSTTRSVVVPTRWARRSRRRSMIV